MKLSGKTEKEVENIKANEKVKDNLSLQEIVKKRYIENDPTLCFDTTPIYKVIILKIIEKEVQYDLI